MGFLTEYFGVVAGSKEIAVCCPFDHYTASGIAYKETNPSAHINTIEDLFHCKACGAGYSEAVFIQNIFGCSYLDARRIQRNFIGADQYSEWSPLALSEASKNKALSLGISETVINELEIKTPPGTGEELAFPVILLNQVMDIRTYNPDHKPKVRSKTGAIGGLIVPYHIWSESDNSRVTLVCAGEKDMAVARSQGFNAITITGGEQALPKLLKSFRGKKIAILYDHDNAGITGAKKLALYLLEEAAEIKVVTNFHEICKEEGEDITDFFMKYGKTREDLIAYMEATPIYVPTEEDLKKKHPLMDLHTATKPENIGKMLQSNIQVVATSEAAYSTPSAVIAEKFKLSGLAASDTMRVHEYREWELTEKNIQDILHLIDNNFTEEDMDKNLKKLMKLPPKERCVSLQKLTKKTVFKVFVTDMFETSDTMSAQPMEYTAYSIGPKLESGKKYLVSYKLVPHPYKGSQLTMIITDAVQASDSVSNFTITPQVKERLKVITDLEGTVAERVELLTEKVKGLLGYNGNNTLIQAIDLAYHTVLQFNFGSFKNVRGYLDTIIVGESRMGKSSTADALRNTYGLGVFTSLAGSSATIPGLIGGSNKTSGGAFQTRAGIIPQNHRGLIIFEEFGKSNANIIKEMTDIRSSNVVRITRVSGTLALPAMVRMIALTNVKSTREGIQPIASYPNGITILTELIDTAEDIARYDLMLVLADRGAHNIDPFWEAERPLDTAVYQTRIRWIWSRTPEQVHIDREVGNYITAQANALNHEYECHIKIFGTEAWKKISRLAIAVAGYLVSTDENYENIIVTKEHVDFAVAYLKRIYDNETFKLKEYVAHERMFTRIDDEGVAALQDLYIKSPALLLHLENSAGATKNTLGAVSGLGNDALNIALNLLTQGMFIRFQGYDIVPTERFRLGMSRIQKQVHARRVGEPNATV